MHELKY